MRYSKTSIIIAAALCGLSMKIYDDLDDNREFFLKTAAALDATSMFYYIRESARTLTCISMTYVSLFNLQFMWLLVFFCLIQYFGKYIQWLYSTDDQDDKLEIGEGFDKAYEKTGLLLMILQACVFQFFGLSSDTSLGITLDAFITVAVVFFAVLGLVGGWERGTTEYSWSKYQMRAIWGGAVMPCTLVANNFIWPYLFGYKGANVGWEAMCVMGIAYMLTSCLSQWILLKNDKSEKIEENQESTNEDSETEEPQEV